MKPCRNLWKSKQLSPAYESAGAAIAEHRSWAAWTTEIYCLRGPRPEVRDQGVSWVSSSWALRKNVFHSSSLASGCLLEVSGLPCLVEVWQHLSLHLQVAFSLCACVSPNFPFLRDTSHIAVGAHTTPAQPHLNCYISNDPISKSGCVLRYWGLWLLRMNFCGTQLSSKYPEIHFFFVNIEEQLEIIYC